MRAEEFAKLVKAKRPPADASDFSGQKYAVIRNSVLAGWGVAKLVKGSARPPADAQWSAPC